MFPRKNNSFKDSDFKGFPERKGSRKDRQDFRGEVDLVRQRDQQDQQKSERIWSPLFVNLMGIGMLASIFSYSFYNILPSITAEITDYPGAGGLLSAVFAAMAGLGRLVSGYITDKWGRFNTLLAADLIFLFGGILPILWPGYAVLLAMRVMQGFAFALILTAVNAAVADIVPPSRLGEGFGYYGMGFAISIAVGPTVGLTLLRFQHHQMTFLGTEVIIILSLILALFCNYEKNRVPFLFFLKKRSDESEKEQGKIGKTITDDIQVDDIQDDNIQDDDIQDDDIQDDDIQDDNIQDDNIQDDNIQDDNIQDDNIQNKGENIERAPAERAAGTVKERTSFFQGFLEPGAFLTMVLGFIYFTGVSFFSSYVTYFAKERGISHPGLFFLCGALTILLSRLLFGRLVDRYSPIKIFIPAIGVFYLSLGILCVLHYTWELALAGFFFGIGVGIVFPLLNTLSIKRSSPKRRGAATATFALGTDTGFALGTLIWGFIGDSWGYNRSIEGVLLVLTCLIILSLCKFRELNKVY